MKDFLPYLIQQKDFQRQKDLQRQQKDFQRQQNFQRQQEHFQRQQNEVILCNGLRRLDVFADLVF